MADQQSTELLSFLQAFNNHLVKYLVVGGYAVNHYGYSRTTSDIDIYVQDTPENRKNIVSALESLGYGKMDELLRVPLLAGYCEIMMDGGMYVDLMSQLTGLDPADFDTQYSGKSVTEIDGIEIPFIGYRDLLKNKEKTGRTKDKDDFEQLSKIWTD
jgi:predicted nucleotidyltransferase